MDWWPSNVCLSVCPVPVPKSRREGHSKLKIGGKEAHDRVDPWPNFEVERSNTCRGGGDFGASHLKCYTVTLMSNRRLVYYDLKAESSGWLFKSESLKKLKEKFKVLLSALYTNLSQLTTNVFLLAFFVYYLCVMMCVFRILIKIYLLTYVLTCRGRGILCRRYYRPHSLLQYRISRV